MTEENRFDALIDSFDGDDEPTPETKPKGKGEGKKSKVKSKDPNYKQIGLYIPEDLHRRTKAGAAMKGLEMSDLATQALELWLSENAPNI
ncbi:MAG: hypothetical protein WBA76_10420 [Phormidesmis sp.]